MELHPNILEKNGKKEFVVLPYEEFRAMQELLEDAEDLLDLRRIKAEEADEPTIPFDEVCRQLGYTPEQQPK
jgi:hypothetical protein